MLWYDDNPPFKKWITYSHFFLNKTTLHKTLVKKLLKIVGWGLLFPGFFVLIIILFVRSPFGQKIIIDKVTQYAAEKTNTKISIDRFLLTFRGNFYLEGLYLEDPEGDTLIYSHKLETGLALIPFIKSNRISVSRIEWEGLSANIQRDSAGDFNFDYLLEAFSGEESSADTTTTSDTASSAAEGYPDISIGPVKIENWNLNFKDDLLGLNGDLDLGKLVLDIESLDLDKMDFHINDFSWENSSVKYQQTKPFPPNQDTTSSNLPPPLLVLDQLSMQHIKVDYLSVPDGIEVHSELRDLLLEMPEANLEDQRILIKNFSLFDSFIDYRSINSGDNTLVSAPADPAQPFSWPDWEVELSAVNLANNEVQYQVKGAPEIKGSFNPNDMGVKGFTFRANNIFLRDDKAGITLNNFSFLEKSGFRLKEGRFKADIGDKTFLLDDVEVATGYSNLKGKAVLFYPSLAALVENPEKATFDLAFNTVNPGIQDAYFFLPALKTDPYVNMFTRKNLRATFYASGQMNKVNVKKLSAKWGEFTFVSMAGKIIDPLSVEQISWDVNEFKFISTRHDLDYFLPQDSLGIQYPDKLDLSLSTRGTPGDFTLKSILKAFEGSIELEGNMVAKEEAYVYDLSTLVTSMPLGEIMGDTSTYGDFGMGLSIKGNTGPLDDLDLHVNTKVNKLIYNGHNYRGLTIIGDILDGKGEIELEHKDDFLDLGIFASVSLDTANYNLGLNLDLKGADLYGLNFSSERIRTRFFLASAFDGLPENFELQTKLTNGTVLLEEESYPMGEIDLDLRISPDSTGFTLQSNLLKGRIQSNVQPGEIYDGLSRHFSRYFLDNYPQTMADSLRPVNFALDFTVPSSLLLQKVLLPGLEKMEEGSIKLEFNESLAELNGSIDFPYLSYSGAVVDSLNFNVMGDTTDLGFDFGLLGLSTGPLDVGATYFSGEVLEKQLNVSFKSFQEQELLANVDFNLGILKDSLKLHIVPDSLIFNKMEWEIPENNEFALGNDWINFKEFEFSRGSQRVGMSHDPEESAFSLTFDDFRLKTFTSFLNPDDLLAAGQVNGSFKVENPFGATGLQANITVKDMELLKVPLGNLALKASGNDQKNYDFSLKIKDKGINLDLNGGFVAEPLGPRLNLGLDLNKFELSVLDGLSAGAIKNGQGFLSGNFTVEGNLAEPFYKGNLMFNEAAFTISTLNSGFVISDSEIRVENAGIYLDEITIQDQKGDKFVLDGNILTEDLINPQFDLSLTADNFRVLNSTREDNDLFYGDAIVGLDVTIEGDLDLPIIDANLEVANGTNLTFVVPESQLDVIERDGIVTFVNRKDPEDILTKRLKETSNSGYTGYKVSMLLNVSQEAVFNLIIDERSGDNLLVEGAADLRLNMDPNGRVTLTGIYELSRGHYELSLYSLVNRRFEIEKGSTITWAGNPMDADMEITAIYRIKTSAADLMAATAAGGTRETMAKFRQQLPFIVYLNINGELLRPDISFRMDMPKDQRGAIGGSVYSQVQQLNNQEGELNRQVFSLLVLNRFFPSGETSGNGGTTALARSSVSQLLSGQLNSFTNNIVGDSGLELDVGLDSFQDYQGNSPQARTQLNVNASKRFLDDRLIVQVGSQIDIEGGSSGSGASNSLLGNVSLEYLLSENGRYRLRGFRKNQFESFIDGQLVVTGISVIFNREFNQFEELWKGIAAKRKERTFETNSEKEENEK